MRAEFIAHESKLMDLLRFPKLLLLDHEDEVYDQTYIDACQAVAKQLEPYREAITFFYVSDEFTSHDFNQIIVGTYPVLGQTQDAYFDYLRNQDPVQLKAAIYDTLLRISQETETTMPNAVTLVESLDLDLKHKWHLMLILDNPTKYIVQYLELIETIQPLFEAFYQPFEKQIETLGQHMADTLNQTGASAIEAMSHGRINRTIVDVDLVRILLSAVFRYGVMINPKPDYINLFWGVSMDHAFEYMDKAIENKLAERVMVFKNFGDKTRYEVIRLISMGVTSIKEIATKVGVSSATISYHLNELISAKIVTLENQNKKYSYIIDYAFLSTIFDDVKSDLGFK